MTISSGIKIIGPAIVVLIILLYAYARVESFARGPEIIITFPSNGLTVLEPLLFVEGVIKSASHITLNGRQIYTNETGELNERILLAEGYNVIELGASDRFGRTTKKNLEIMYELK
ncbi:MAG: hypothetical protein Q8R36_02920 [bacterium]|nr:hypothetical protein [bacterium]